MSKYSNQNLDEFFQQGSEKYDFEYNPAAWAQMEAMLDRKERRRMAWWWFGTGVLLIIGITLLVLLFFHPTEPIKSPSPIVAEYSPKSTLLPAQPADCNEDEQSVQHLSSEMEQTTGATLSVKRVAPGEKKGGVRTEHTTIAPRRTAGMVAPPVVQPMIKPPMAHSPTEDNRIKKAGQAIESAVIPAQRLGLLEVLPLSPLKPITGPGRVEDIFTSRQERTGLKIPSPMSKNRLSFGPSASLALNSTGWGDFSRTAWKAGGVLEYQYSSRYGLSIGLFYQKMNYSAEKGEYVPPKGFWTRKIAPEETDGQCILLEAPVLLKYYFQDFKKSGLFASAGFTSYFLLEEHYHYFYELPDPDLIRYWMTDQVSRHWLATGQFSVGYQAMLTPKLSLQAAPYLQVPLSGIGHGQVKIYSIGMDVRILLGR